MIIRWRICLRTFSDNSECAIAECAIAGEVSDKKKRYSAELTGK